MKKVLLLMALLLVGGVVQGREGLRYSASGCLKIWDCEKAPKIYDMYKRACSSRDREIELRIAVCKSPTITTTPTNGIIKTIRVGKVDLRMVYVKGGTFMMGAQSINRNGTNYEVDAYDYESPVHNVILDGFYIGETEVTQALWREVMGDEPTYSGGWTTEYGRGDDYPAYWMSYTDIQIFIEKLNRMTGLTFRLPTEAEWEYAARGGSQSRGCKYSGSNTLDDVAWHYDNSGSKTHMVKEKQANELGLYDMSGNVWEWCQDWYGNYGSGSQYNPQGPSSGHNRVLRGGSWSSIAKYCRITDRFDYFPDHRFNDSGFRLVLQ